MASLTLVTLPHLLRLPFWVTSLVFACIGWRILIFTGRAGFPGRLPRILLVVSAVVFVGFEFQGRGNALNPTVTLLILGFVFKLLEMQRKRDVYITVCLSYIVLTSEFFYSQSIPTTLYIALTTVAVNGTLISLNQQLELQSTKRSLKLSFIVLSQSIPLAITLFVLVPRTDPLWTAQFQTTAAKTGVTDIMSPGNISSLVGSGELAFRVDFDGDPPNHEQLYWRGLVLDYFDGTSWSRSRTTRQEMRRRARNRFGQESGISVQNEFTRWQTRSERVGDSIGYTIILEPTQQNWIYSLHLPESGDADILAGPNFDLYSRNIINQRTSYGLRSHLNNITDLTLDTSTRELGLQLPDFGNSRSRELALQIRSQVDSDEEYLNQILSLFSVQEFFYTLTPPLLNGDRIDDFLFSTRQGYCEHFTSAFVYLMRAANVPARVVVGYQGAEYNPFDDYFMVHQYNAHAWAEVWLENQGWVRVDPTVVVSPERINNSVETAIGTQAAFLQESRFTLLRYRDSPLINSIRLRLDAIDYAWDRWVVSFDEELQSDLWDRVFGNSTLWLILLYLFILAATVLGIIAYFVLRTPTIESQDRVRINYLRFCKKMEGLGYRRKQGEGPLDYCERISDICPQWASSMKAITNLYVELAYREPIVDVKQNKTSLKLFTDSIGKFHPHHHQH